MTGLCIRCQVNIEKKLHKMMSVCYQALTQTEVIHLHMHQSDANLDENFQRISRNA